MRRLTPPKLVHVGMSGASGMQYGLRLVEILLKSGIDISLYFTKAAKLVGALEMELNVSKEEQLFKAINYKPNQSAKLSQFSIDDWTAPIASGSNVQGPVVICPCSMGMLSAISIGASNNLLERAADVAIKEGTELIIVPRETPFSAIHLENMLKLTKLGVCVLPANPGFYHKPKSIDDIIDFVVARILDRLGVPQDLITPWGDSK